MTREEYLNKRDEALARKDGDAFLELDRLYIAELEAQLAEATCICKCGDPINKYCEGTSLCAACQASLEAHIAELERHIKNATDEIEAVKYCLNITSIDFLKVLERIKYILTNPPEEEK